MAEACKAKMKIEDPASVAKRLRTWPLWPKITRQWMTVQLS